MTSPSSMSFPAPGPELLAHTPPVLICGLEKLHTQMQIYLLKHKELTTKKSKITMTDHENIPQFYDDGFHFLRMMEVARDAITLKYPQMSNQEILTIGEIMDRIKVEESRVQIILTWFRSQMALVAFVTALRDGPSAV